MRAISLTVTFNFWTLGTKNLASNIGHKAQDTTETVVEGGKGAINTTIDTTGRLAHGAADKTSEVAHNVWDGTKNTAVYLADGTRSAASNVADGTKNLASNVYDGTKTAATNVAQGAKNVAAAGAEKTEQAWEGTRIVCNDIFHHFLTKASFSEVYQNFAR